MSTTKQMIESIIISLRAAEQFLKAKKYDATMDRIKDSIAALQLTLKKL